MKKLLKGLFSKRTTKPEVVKEIKVTEVKHPVKNRRNRKEFNNRKLTKARNNIQIIKQKDGTTRTIVHDKVNDTGFGYLKTMQLHDIVINKKNQKPKTQRDRMKLGKEFNDKYLKVK